MDSETYSSLIYKSFNISSTKERINLTFEYEVPDYSTFKHQIRINKNNFKIRPISSNLIQSLIFNIGMVVLLDYWHLVKTPTISIDCCILDQDQISWWKDFYFNSINEQININNNATNKIVLEKIIYDDNDFSGYIVPIEDKNSCITLETLNLNKQNDYCLVFDNDQTLIECAELAGFTQSNIINVLQTYDKKIVDLPSKDNSSLVAFTTYFLCYLLSKKYVAVSNSEKVKTYGRSIEFENAFRKYADKFLPTPIEYFSFLRPLNNLQVAKTYAKLTKYHPLYNTASAISLDKKIQPSMAAAKFNSSYYIVQNNLIPEQEFLLKKILL